MSAHDDQDKTFGDAAVSRGFITSAQLDECRKAAKLVTQAGLDRPLADIIVEKGFITAVQAEMIGHSVASPDMRIIAGFELLGKLGEGGMGIVYKARQASMDRLVALKLMPERLAKDASFVARFFREARVAAKLDHPNIVRGIDVGSVGSDYYFAMEFIEGESVGDFLRRDGKMPEARALHIVVQVARALVHAEKHNLIHRDIKPDNILIAEGDVAKLADLGLARSTSDDMTKVTRTGMAVGTPHYISPEQARGVADVDTQADIYSLGATLYHMLVGAVPFEGSTIAVVITKTLSEDPVPANERNPEVSEGTGLVAQKMMAKGREARYRTPNDLVEDLEDVIAGRDPRHATGTSGAPSGLTRAGVPVTPAGAARTALTGAAGTGVPAATTPTLEARAAAAGQMVPARGAKRGLLVPVLLGMVVIIAAAVAVPFVLKGLGPREEPAQRVDKKGPDPTEPTGADAQRGLEAEDERDWRRAKAEARSRASNGDHVGALATVDGFLGSARTAKFNAEATDLRAEIETKRAEVEEKRRTEREAKEERKAEEAASAKRIARRKAEEEARRAAQKSTKSEAARMLERAQEAARNGDLSGALTFYRAAGKQGADVRAKIGSLEKQVGYGAALVRAREQMAAEKWKAAVASLEKLLKAHPGDKAAQALLAETKKNIGPEPALTFDLGGGVKLEMIYIKPGRFVMGSARGWFDEKPVHEVVLTKGFYLGKYEVTQSQFKTLTGVNRSRLKGEEHPVVEVSWPDAADFCKRLSKKAGRNFRLPTEAEWEYAARAGSAGKYSYGNDENKLDGYGWYKLNSKNKTHPVGQKLPNPWGLYDMPGNVWEWCADWHYKGYYGKSPREDPKGPDRSTGKRVVRGGCYDTKAATCTVSERNATRATGREKGTGFRAAMDP